MEVACKDAFDQGVGRMVCQNQRDGKLVKDYIHRLRNNCLTGCDCHAISSLLNNLLWIATINNNNKKTVLSLLLLSKSLSSLQDA